jgi:hypothetical protein
LSVAKLRLWTEPEKHPTLPLAFALVASLLAAPGVRAATLTPTIAQDELASHGAGCSLREAVLQANRNVVVDAACGLAGEAGATDTITLAPGVTYLLTLPGADDLSEQGDLDLADNPAAEDLAILGSGSTIGNASSPKDRVLHVLAGASVAASGVTIRDGLAAGESGAPSSPGEIGVGGGIWNEGTLRLTDCAVIGNRAAGGTGGSGRAGGAASGGGIASAGPIALTDCVVEGNRAEGGRAGSPALDPDLARGGEAFGGGIASGVDLALLRTRVRGNLALGGTGGPGPAFGGRAGFSSGGGVLASAALSVVDSLFEGNVARGGRGGDSGTGLGYFGGGAAGGGLSLQAGGQSIRATTFAGNRAEGGEGGAGAVGTGCGGNAQGGGIYKLTSPLAVANSTLSGNAVLQGPGEGESCGENLGGGIFLSMGGVTLDSVTLTASTGGGIFSDGQLTLTNSIVALQSSGSDCTPAGGSLVALLSNDFNIDSDGTCRLGAAHDQPGVAAFELGLGPLADNGGPTPTHAIIPGRAAFDRGATTLGTDQRGISRPQHGGADIGAFEQERGVSVADVPAVSPWGMFARRAAGGGGAGESAP